MPYDEDLAGRVREALGGRADVAEKHMFGGLTFLVGGHMCCGVVGDDLVLRLGPEDAQQALREPHARPMDFTGRPLRGFVYVGPAGTGSEHLLGDWVSRALRFASSLPPKH